MPYAETYDDDGPREPFELKIPGRSQDDLLGLRARLPWPLAGVPFSFDDLLMMYGTYIGVRPTEKYDPVFTPVSLEPCGERADPNDVCVGKDAIPPLDAVLAWLTTSIRRPGSGEVVDAVPTFAWPTRLLSVLAWLARESNTYQLRSAAGLGYVQVMRHFPRPGIVPGGHLDALLQLSLRVVRDAAGPLHDALSEAGLLQSAGVVPKPGGPPRLLADAIAGLSPVPGAPLDGWSVSRELRKGESARRLYSWGWASRARCAHELQKLADELLAVVDPGAEHKRSSLRFTGRHRLRSADEQVAEWLETYLLVCARWLRLVTLATRVLLHHVYLALLVYHGPPDLRYNALYREHWADALPTLARLPADAFAGFASRLVERAQLPPATPWYLEREFEIQVATHGRSALEIVWGITRTTVDRMDRAGVVDPTVIDPPVRR